MILIDYVIWFFIYSICGWGYETIYCSIQAGEFVKRGFSNGPYLPIYGFGAVFLILLLRKHMTKISLFFYSMIVTTILEYFTSWLLELIFHKTWWDYTNYTLQLNGRICLLAALLFGILGVVLINYIQPRIKWLTDKIPSPTKFTLAIVCTIILCTDFVFSIFKALR